MSVTEDKGDWVTVRTSDLSALLAAWDGQFGEPYNRDQAFQAVPRLRASIHESEIGSQSVDTNGGTPSS